MAFTALNIARCIIAIARNVKPGLIGGGTPTGWTVLTPISSQSVITLADAVTVGAPASTTTSASRLHFCITISSPCFSDHNQKLKAASQRMLRASTYHFNCLLEPSGLPWQKPGFEMVRGNCHADSCRPLCANSCHSRWVFEQGNSIAIRRMRLSVCSPWLTNCSRNAPRLWLADEFFRAFVLQIGACGAPCPKPEVAAALPDEREDQRNPPEYPWIIE